VVDRREEAVVSFVHRFDGPVGMAEQSLRQHQDIVGPSAREQRIETLPEAFQLSGARLVSLVDRLRRDVIDGDPRAA
jgi:hypothetical protein